MSQELKDKTGCVYTGIQLCGKYNICKDLHRRFLEVLNHTGLTFNAETNKAEVDDAVWESFFKVWLLVSSRRAERKEKKLRQQRRQQQQESAKTYNRAFEKLATSEAHRNGFIAMPEDRQLAWLLSL
nr:L10-interacting MYB domain-containing protein-like [Ipomoea batatas]